MLDLSSRIGAVKPWSCPNVFELSSHVSYLESFGCLVYKMDFLYAMGMVVDEVYLTSGSGCHVGSYKYVYQILNHTVDLDSN